MRRLMILVALLAAAGACTSAPTTTTTTTASLPPTLVDFEIKSVQVGDRELVLAIADNPSLRAQGLMGVTDLEDLDGMLFFWRHDGDAFWMKDTLIPLDIVWFNEDGTYKDRASMVPCTEDPCATYMPTDGLDFRYAIEANPGDLDWITESTVIAHIDD